jgi:hypothetical protein
LDARESSDFGLEFVRRISISTGTLSPVQDTFMRQNESIQQEQLRADRWAESLKELSRSRGNPESTGTRAVQLGRQLNISPWIALGVAEGLLTLSDARLLDRVGRCRELQSAILDKRRTIEELRYQMPYAAHFLAADVQEQGRKKNWDDRTVIRILDAILGAEQRKGDAISPKVRVLPVADYVVAVDRVVGIMRRTRCDVAMALDVDAGHTTEEFAAAYIRQKQALEREERRQRLQMSREDQPHFPRRRENSEPDGRRSVFQGGERQPPRMPMTTRDHWPKT